MSKGNILVVSRTPWYEPPRLRHQLSRMLRDMGYEITYVETLFRKRGSVSGEKGISVHNIRELTHHQLQPFSFIHGMAACHAAKQLKKIVAGRDISLVVNFNYDYAFLHSVLPGVPIATVINDDFISMAKPWMKKAAERYLTDTIRVSSHTLSVSYPLHNYLKKHTENCTLLLPWSEKEYERPFRGLKRDVALYYGYVSRLDESIIDGLIEKGITLRFVGPLEGNGEKLKKKYSGVPNISFHPPNDVAALNTDDVCCSIAPYDMQNEFIKAATASNRLFRLLAVGIPFVCTLMPNLIAAPVTVIRQCDSTDAFEDAIRFFQANFDNVQNDIENFLNDHTWRQRKKLVEDIIVKLTHPDGS